MTPDTNPVPAAPTPYTDAQIRAIHGENQYATYESEATTPAFPCPYWHWVDRVPVPCVKPDGHQRLETWALMEHADASDSSSGPWFGVPVPVLRAVAEAALVTQAGPE
jgi:hypothetical protein